MSRPKVYLSSACPESRVGMAKRREVLQAAVAISVAPILNARAFWFAAPLNRPTRASSDEVMVDGLVFDNRFSESIEVSRSAARRGAKLHEIDGDVTALWYGHLDFHWRAHPGALAGITGPDALFVLENLAWDRRLRVAYRGIHSPPSGDFATHRLSGPPSLVEPMSPLWPYQSWTETLGRTLALWPGRSEAAKSIDVKPLDKNTSGRAANLISWVIVPRAWGLDPV